MKTKIVVLLFATLSVCYGQLIVKTAADDTLMTITRDGRIGAGTSNPKAPLHVIGKIIADTLVSQMTPASSSSDSVLVLSSGETVAHRELDASVWDGDDDTITKILVNGTTDSLTGTVTFIGGTNINIAQSNQDVTISASGTGGGDTDWTIKTDGSIYRPLNSKNVGIWTQNPLALLHIFQTDDLYQNVNMWDPVISAPSSPSFRSGLHTQVPSPQESARYAQGVHSYIHTGTAFAPPEQTHAALNGQLTEIVADAPLMLAEGYNGRHDNYYPFNNLYPEPIENSIYGLYGHSDLHALPMVDRLPFSQFFSGAVTAVADYDTMSHHQATPIHQLSHYAGFFYGPKTFVSRNLCIGTTLPAPDDPSTPTSTGTTNLTVTHIPPTSQLPPLVWDQTTGGVYYDSSSSGQGSGDNDWTFAGADIWRQSGNVGIHIGSPLAKLHILDTDNLYTPPFSISDHRSGLLTEVPVSQLSPMTRYAQGIHSWILSPPAQPPDLQTYSAVNGQLTGPEDMGGIGLLLAEGYNARHDSYAPDFMIDYPDIVNAIYGLYGHTDLDMILTELYLPPSKFTAAVLGYADYNAINEETLILNHHYAGFFQGPKTYVNQYLCVGTHFPDLASNLTVMNLPPASGSEVPVYYNQSTGGFYWSGVSSKKYKENIQPLSDYEKILDAEAKSFTYKSSGVESVGLIAEEIDALGLEKLVYYKEEKPEGIRYNLLSVYLLKLVQQQQEEISDLQTRLQALEKK